MPISFKAPQPETGDHPDAAASLAPAATLHRQADARNSYRSPLVDALVEQLRQARAVRRLPH